MKYFTNRKQTMEWSNTSNFSHQLNSSTYAQQQNNNIHTLTFSSAHMFVATFRFHVSFCSFVYAKVWITRAREFLLLTRILYAARAHTQALHRENGVAVTNACSYWAVVVNTVVARIHEYLATNSISFDAFAWRYYVNGKRCMRLRHRTFVLTICTI